MIKCLITIFLLCLCYSNLYPQYKTYGVYEPSLEYSNDPSFTKWFKGSFFEAVKSKDKDYLISVIDSDIQLNEHQTEENGIQYFFEKFDLNDNEIWDILYKFFYIGAREMSYGEYRGYYFTDNDPKIEGIVDNELDGYVGILTGNYNMGFAIKENVYVYPTFSFENPFVKLKRHILKVDMSFVDDTFYRVLFKGGEDGYVAKKDFYLVVSDYYMNIEFKEGSWKITALEETGL